MDIVVTLTTFLAPFLPTLLNLGAKAATGAVTKAGETAGTKLTENALHKAEAIWQRLRPKVEAKEAAQEAVTDVAQDPEDADSLAALRKQFKKILEADPELATAIAELLQSDAPDGTPGAQVVQTVIGEYNQTLGQMSGGMTIHTVTGNVTLQGEQ